MKSPASSTAAATDLSSPATSKALAREVRAFCERNQLTPRESDIMVLLVEGVVRIKDVAARLKLSPNTVNNHVNSIFTKTKTRSKSQVLAALLASVAEELQAARAHRHTPRVLVFEAGGEGAGQTTKELDKRGLLAMQFTTLDSLEPSIAEFGPDYVLIDASAISTPKAAMERIRRISPAQVVFIANGSIHSCREAMDMGAIDCLERPLNFDRLADLFYAHAIEDDGERWRWFEKGANQFKTLPEILQATRENIGVGGITLPLHDIERALGHAPTVGDWLEFKLKLEQSQQAWNVRGQVVWAQPERGVAGVRFTYLGKAARESLMAYARQNAVHSYIPGLLNI